MRVTIDGGCWANRRGFGRFLRELVRALAERNRHQYTIILDPPGAAMFPFADRFRVVTVGTRHPVNQAAAADGRRSLTDLFRMSWAATRIPSDVYFFPAVYSYFPLLKPAPMLLGIHDTMADTFPEMAFASGNEQRFWNWKVKLALWQASAILTVSNYAARSIQSRHKIPEDRIHVLPEGAAPVFGPIPVAPPEVPFILAVGGLSPNKNLGTLIRAFGRIAKDCPGTQLFLVGDYEGDSFRSSYADLCRLVKDCALENRIRFTGYVSDEELVRLYNQAALLAFPSLEEGFGLPAVEAMSCGLPVVASNQHALAEVIGDAGLLVDPQDEVALGQGMLRVLRDPLFRMELSRRSLQRAQRFSWSRSAEHLEELFERIARN